MDSRKKLVRDCYDTVAEAYLHAIRRRPVEYPEDAACERAWFERFAARLPAGARVLDVGCGNGEPYLVGLAARGFRVAGLDFSHRQLVRARDACPGALVLEADMTAAAFAHASFDGVMAYHSIWHVPREEHGPLFARMRSWLVDGGLALITLAAVPAGEPGGGPGLFTDLLGAPSFYDARHADDSFALLKAAGFAILDYWLPKPRNPAGGVFMILASASPA